DERNTVVGAPYVKGEHYPVFDCAVGERAIHYRGHVKMMGAIQPFISGAISKTVNLPETATIDEVAQLYVESWKLGVKAVAIYRDNCKVAQPLSGKAEKGAQAALAPAGLVAAPRRRRLPDDRNEIGRKFRGGEYEGYTNGGGAAKPADTPAPGQTAIFNSYEVAIECNRCGGRMVRAGTCYTCRDCGTSTGCG